jgi:hypothetical protein
MRAAYPEANGAAAKVPRCNAAADEKRPERYLP